MWGSVVLELLGWLPESTVAVMRAGSQTRVAHEARAERVVGDVHDGFHDQVIRCGCACQREGRGQYADVHNGASANFTGQMNQEAPSEVRKAKSAPRILRKVSDSDDAGQQEVYQVKA